MTIAFTLDIKYNLIFKIMQEMVQTVMRSILQVMRGSSKQNNDEEWQKCKFTTIRAKLIFT